MAFKRINNNYLTTLFLIISVLSGLLFCCGSKTNTIPDRPNIILIMADDLGYGDVSCYNPESKIPTPNIDKLASEGMRFMDAHSSSSVCTPTRYALLTGRYAWRGILKSGVIEGNHTPLLEEGRPTIGTLLKKSGYKTAVIGKWHVGLTFQNKAGKPAPEEKGRFGGEQIPDSIDFTKPIINGPEEHGFDYSYITPGCPTDDIFNFFVENGIIEGTVVEEENWYLSEGWMHEKIDTMMLNRGKRFITDHISSNSNDPFFLYLPLSVPHIPWNPPGFVQGKSEAGNRGDQCILADWIVGQIDAFLDINGLSENTILIFTSDNGPNPNDPTSVNGHAPAGKLRGSKGMIWEGGHRIPFIVRWPGKVKTGSTNKEVVSLIDLFSTFGAITGQKLTENMAEDSFDILPYMLTQPVADPIRPDIIHHSGAGVFSIRKGKWKLIVGTKEGGYLSGGPEEGAPGQLYDLESDPAESKNLYSEMPETVQSLTLLLDRYKEQGYSRKM